MTLLVIQAGGASLARAGLGIALVALAGSASNARIAFSIVIQRLVHGACLDHAEMHPGFDKLSPNGGGGIR